MEKPKNNYPLAGLFEDFRAGQVKTLLRVARHHPKNRNRPSIPQNKALLAAFDTVKREIEKIEGIVAGIIPRGRLREREKTLLLKFSDPQAARNVLKCAAKLKKRDPFATATSIADKIWWRQTTVFCWTVGSKVRHRMSKITIKRLARCIFGNHDLRKQEGKRTKIGKKKRKRSPLPIDFASVRKPKLRK